MSAAPQHRPTRWRLAPRPQKKPGAAADPCRYGMDLLQSQVIFLTARQEDPALGHLAPDYGIDPAFWTPGCAAHALRRALPLAGRSLPRRP